MKDDAMQPADQAQLTRIIEAALLAAREPLSISRIESLLSSDEQPGTHAVRAALQTLQEACADRGVELVEVASGWRYQVRTVLQPWVGRLWTERQTRYSRALLETLALIAYRQPVTRGEIEQVRGVAVSTSIVRTLEEREWIRVVGYRDVPGKPALYGTTREFLDYFQLKSLDELPTLAEVRDLENFMPELEFDAPAEDAEAPADTPAPDPAATVPAAGPEAPATETAARGGTDMNTDEEKRA